MLHKARGHVRLASSAGPATRTPVVPVPPQTRTFDLVVVGGVPGAGKSTAIVRATAGLDDVSTIDPEQVSAWLRQRLPSGIPYRGYRWLVHATHTIRVVAELVTGPVSGRRLVIHDPGTRIRRRNLLLALARAAGWRTALLYIDADRAAAIEGQRRRGRVVRSFDEHWANWERLRPELTAQARRRQTLTEDEPVLLVDRADAVDALRRLCAH